MGNLSGQPNPPLFMPLCVCKHASMCMHWGAFSRNLSNYVASPGSPRQVSVSGCVSGAHISGRALEAGASWSRRSEPSINLMRRACQTKPLQYLRPPFLNTYTLHEQYTMENKPPLIVLEPVEIYTTNHTHTHKHTVRLGLHRNTAVLVQQSTPGISLRLFVLEWPSFWAFSCTSPPFPSLPIPLHYTKQSQIKHRLT